MTTRIIFARHGNTFAPGETPLRVGAKTDLDLVETTRGTGIGLWLVKHDMVPDAIFSGPLKRQYQTAILAALAMDINPKTIKISHDFSEINYGPDEAKTEEELVARIGQDAIDKWNKDATVPDGWEINPNAVIKSWQDFADMVSRDYHDKTVLVASSNGTMRFIPYITGDFEAFSNTHDIKVPTGGVCVFEQETPGENWTCKLWGEKAFKEFPDSESKISLEGLLSFKI